MKIFEEDQFHQVKISTRRRLSKKMAVETQKHLLQSLIDKLEDADKADEKFRF